MEFLHGELLNKSYALSLSDQYWLKEETSNIQWKDINFFSNDFEYKTLLHSRNNTTDGMLQKGWIIENGKRILVKGTYTFNREKPFNEKYRSPFINSTSQIDVLKD